MKLLDSAYNLKWTMTLTCTALCHVRRYSLLPSDEDPSAKGDTAEPVPTGRLQRTGSGGSTRGQLPVLMRRPPSPESRSRIAQAFSGARFVMGIPTFRIIILQGIVGSLPWQAMIFFTTWMQLLGFSGAWHVYAIDWVV